jgi:hypothetical protein
MSTNTLTCKYCGAHYERWQYYDGPEHGFETEAFICDCCEPCWYRCAHGMARLPPTKHQH